MGPNCEGAGKKPRWWTIVDDKLSPKRIPTPKCSATRALSLDEPEKVGLREISQILVTF